ncbi:MAG: hypothetical protein GVY13_14080 [Alphaproteobacteria bacterium]|jgi:hypothetical protein|nr:hypothetical protein [Alphaproteobacteria bacterium]
MFRGYEELAQFHEANFEAVLRGTGAVGRGVDDLQVAVISLVKGAGQTAISAAAAVPGCQGVSDVVQLQSHVMKGLFDTCISRSRRMVAVQRATAREVLRPVEERFLAGVEVLARAA